MQQLGELCIGFMVISYMTITNKPVLVIFTFSSGSSSVKKSLFGYGMAPPSKTLIEQNKYFT